MIERHPKFNPAPGHFAVASIKHLCQEPGCYEQASPGDIYCPSCRAWIDYEEQLRQELIHSRRACLRWWRRVNNVLLTLALLVFVVNILVQIGKAKGWLP